MKPIAKVLLFILSVPLFIQCDKHDPGPIVPIPDNNLMNALIVLGIEAFVNLDTLRCVFHGCTELDISNSTALRCLSCGIGNLTSLDVSNNTDLTSGFNVRCIKD